VLIRGKAVFSQQGNLISLHGTIEDITERKTRETALVQTNEELKRSNEELDRFVYSVSHDLRSPLLSMGGIVDITREETEEELTREHMTMLKGSISRLDNFIGEILSYSRNASGGLKVSTVDFKQLLTEISNDLRYMSGNAKRVDILVDIDQQDEFHTDHGRFRIIMNNLISNAIRYHNPHADNPYVKIRATAGRQTTLIEIEDNGIGIPAKHQEKVFEMFYRVSENSCGSGLGLYIVKETVEKLKGNIRIESSEGIGTKCIINLPNLFTNN
jgi:signal transduction histidine kinase